MEDNKDNKSREAERLENGIKQDIAKAHIPDFKFTPPTPATPPPPTENSSSSSSED